MASTNQRKRLAEIGDAYNRQHMPDLRLTEIVQRVDQDRLVVPEFQRGFKWQTPDIRKLLESLLLDFPIGAALFWRTQRNMLEFRRIEEVQFSEGEDEEPNFEGHEEGKSDEIDFILDGQQRITSIYKLFPKTLAPTDQEYASRFKGLRYFLDLRRLGLPHNFETLRVSDFSKFKDPDNVADAIVEKRHADLRKEFKQVSRQKTVPQRLTDSDLLRVCQHRRWLPLTRSLLENKQSQLSRIRREVEGDFRNQIDTYQGPESRVTLEDLVATGLDRWSDWFTSEFQATLNSKSLTCLIHGNEQPEGLARIFETINSTGLSLSVFDLLVARLGTWPVEGTAMNLRKLILTRVDKSLLQKFDDDRSLGGVASQQFPRLLALRTNKELKKGDILQAKKEVFLPVIDVAASGLQFALSTATGSMGVIDHTYLPFKDLIAIIGAIYSGETWTYQQRIVVAYLWSACLIEDWDSGTNDKTRSAFRDLKEILTSSEKRLSFGKRLYSEFPDYEQVRDATTKSSILFRTFMAFNLSRRGTDWAGCPRSPEGQEDHHIFPRDWLANNRDQRDDKQLWASLRDSVLNRIFVSRKANIGAKAQITANYLSKLPPAERRVLQIPDSFLESLQSPITSEAFSALLQTRYELMKDDIIDYILGALSLSKDQITAELRRDAEKSKRKPTPDGNDH